MKIVTSLFVDKHDFSKNPQLSHLNFTNKRMAYWNCCSTFFATSVKVNPKEQHVLYTNDTEDALFHGVDIKKFLIDLGVEIVHLSMNAYKVPSKYSSFLTGAFYKLEVINALGENNNEDVCLLDSDCIWIKPCDPIKEILAKDKIVLFDVYKLHDLDTLSPHGLSRREILEVFSKLSPGYPNREPVRFGGEIIAASAKNIKIIAKELLKDYNYVISKLDEIPHFKNGKKFMDGMEIFASYVYNKLPIEYIDSEDARITRRVWTAPNVNNVSATDINLVIWHLIAEKHRGIPLLSEELLNKNSKFWSLKKEDVGQFLGAYLGIPERKVKIKEKTFLEKLLPSIKNKIKEKITAFR